MAQDEAAPSPKPTEATRRPRGPVLADDGGVPEKLTRLAILVGLGLAVAGAVMMWLVYPRLFNAGSLAMCIGFGLVLAALGTRVAGTWQSWSVAGGGGISIILFLLLHALPAPPPDTPVPTFARGNLHGTNEATSVRMFGAQFMLVGRGNPSEHFRFVAFPEDLRSPNFYLLIVNDKDPSLREAYIGCIPTDLILSKMKSSEMINFSVEKATSEYKLRDLLDGKEIGEFGGPNCRAGMTGRPKAASAPPSPVHAVLERIGTAFGMAALANKAPKRPKAPSVADLIRALEAESSEIRASARDDLAEARDAASLAQMTSSWSIDKSSYRGDLGRLVAWTNAIRDERETAVSLSAALSTEQLGYLVRLTGHADRTMRYNATELVSWMLQSTGWPTAPAPDKTKALVDEITKVFAEPELIKMSKPGTEFDFANTAFNTLVAIDDAKCVLKPDARQSISTALAPFEKKYDKELPKTVAMSQDIRAILAKAGC